jgi:plasmid maintenance system antidote protein VapI
MNDYSGSEQAPISSSEASGLRDSWLSQSRPNSRRLLDISTPTGRLLVVLKQQFRVRGLHYRDVAARLKISERTVKRHLSGKGLTIDALQRLADVVELDMLSLLILAQQHAGALPDMTKQQQTALRKDTLALAVFYFLNLGMQPAQIAREFDLAAQIDGVLDKLENFGLVHRFSSNGVKVLVSRPPDERVADHLSDRCACSVRKHLQEVDLEGANANWLYQAVRLSHASALRLERLMKRFVSEAMLMTKSEIDLPADQTQWYRLFAGTEPTSRKKLLRGV